MPKIFRFRFTVPPEANDENGHVNNVVYVQWMQDVATRHSDAQGCTRELYHRLDSSWVVRSHLVEYLRPAFAGDEIEVLTWVCNLKRTRSLRRYRFLRAGDQTLLAKAETDWVYVNAENGRPRSVDQEVIAAFELVEPEEEPKIR
jgi:acyl-CoA thioester hydrolase